MEGCMSLKHTLAAVALATTLSNVNASEKPQENNQINFNEPYNVLHIDPQKRQVAQDKYKQKFKEQMNNISGAWFSFGDEKQLRQALYEVAHTPHGQNIIANLPDDMPIETSRFLAEHIQGLFSSTDVDIKFPSSNVLLKPFYHELLHAVQFNLGEFDNKGFNVEQVVANALLLEAETKGWDHIHTTMELQFGTLHPSQEAINDFMKKDLISVSKKEIGKDFDEEYFKATNRSYSFQQSLRKYRGNLYEAQKEEVGKDIAACMNIDVSRASLNDQAWKSHYTNQGLKWALSSMYKGYLTAEGDEERYQRHINRIATQYHVHPDDIDCLVISDSARKVLDNLHEFGLKGGYDVGRKNQQNGWKNCVRISENNLVGCIKEYKQIDQACLKRYYSKKSR